MSEAHIELTNAGQGKVILDGYDISQHVNGLDISARVGEMTRLTLYTSGSPKITHFNGEVQVEIAEPLRATLLMAGWTEPQ